ESPEVIDGYDLFRTELDFLRTAIEESYDNPARRIGWAEHPDEGTVEFVPPDDLKSRFDALPQNYLAERQVKQRLVLATDKATGKAELQRARDNVGSKLSWPQAHYLGPLHPVLDWAADKALARFGRGQVPVVTGAVDHPLVIGMGTYSNRRGQVVLRSVAGVGFLEPTTPYELQEDVVMDILVKSGVRDGGINTGREIDVARWQPLVPLAVAELRGYMAGLLNERTALVQEPLVDAAMRIRQWRKSAKQLALDLPPNRRSRVEQEVDLHGSQALDLCAELSARDEPMLRVLAVIVPEESAR
ncbi:MAG: hypothetical protein ACRDSQ_31430, partial [Actinokineospora sp.]